ncbi:MAG: M23 family metallopeptidase [Acholeplasma sp.]|nr:M23 family metallopeptidase [Acholeplasma sp.]
MKKYIPYIVILITTVISFFLIQNYGNKKYPNEYYNVYIDSKLIGIIKSEKELNDYIDEVTSHYINVEKKEKKYYIYENGKIKEETANIISSNKKENLSYGEDEKGKYVILTTEKGEYINTVYTPSGLRTEKILTYKNKLDSVEDIYKKIQDTKPFTIKGYQFTIKKGDKTKYIYVTNQDIFEKAVNSLIETYVGEDIYSNYLNDTQEEVKTTGSIVENVYIEEEITFKEKQIPINEVIYSDERLLAQYLLFGNEPKTTIYKVGKNEMIEDIALNNKISTKEFLISNPEYKTANSLIKENSEVNIKETNPQLSVVSEQYVVEDKINEYKTTYKYDSNKYVGYTEVIQKGENGLERVSQRIKVVNGSTVYVEPKGKEVLKTSVDKIVLKGDKFIPNVGDLTNWAWPSESGYTNTDGWGWRIHPITGERSFHYGIDIAGTGYNSDVYSANNGTVVVASNRYDFGNYIIVDHNNGYYTLYGHMNKFAKGIKVGTTVAKGQLIGYVGSTGYSTGPHIHFEVWKDCRYCRVSPWSIYR